MLRGMRERTISVTEFKARCLALLEEVGSEGGTITIMKRGKPLAEVRPARQRRWKSPEGSLSHLDIPDDAFDRDLSDIWEVTRETGGA
jgi:prevent-host-death family protein